MEKNFSKYCKPNTKEFWQNVWFYYKVHIFAAIAILLLIVYTIGEIVDRKDPDFAFMYVGEQTLVNEEETRKFFEKYVTDVNGDGTVYPNVLNIALGNGEDAQYASALIQKADLTIAADETPVIMLIDEDYIERYIEMDAFAPIDDVLQKYGVEEDKIRYSDDNKAICVDVTGTEFAKKVGYAWDKTAYLGIQFKRENKKDDEEYLKMYTETERVFELILSGDF